MSSNVWRQLAAIGAGAILATTTIAAERQTTGSCSESARHALAAAAAAAAAADGEVAARNLRAAYEGEPACASLAVASWSWHAWLAAARAAGQGGTATALASVKEALDVLEPGGRPRRLEAAYAAAVVHAAAAAAQHERDEMRVWLEHAGGLAGRLPADAQEWPLPLPLVEGELWLVVDDFDLAEAAFARAGDRSPAGLRGVARTRARRGELAGACGPFRAALALVEADRPDGPLAVEARAFLRLCP